MSFVLGCTIIIRHVHSVVTCCFRRVCSVSRSDSCAVSLVRAAEIHLCFLDVRTVFAVVRDVWVVVARRFPRNLWCSSVVVALGNSSRSDHLFCHVSFFLQSLIILSSGVSCGCIQGHVQHLTKRALHSVAMWDRFAT